VPAEFDFTARYAVDSYGGIAFYAVSYERVCDEDFEWTGIETENRERVVMMMVGDDRPFTFGIDEVTVIEDEDYCSECGQIGCKGDFK
jgi:hypothetical protein